MWKDSFRYIFANGTNPIIPNANGPKYEEVVAIQPADEIYVQGINKTKKVINNFSYSLSFGKNNNDNAFNKTYIEIMQ